MSDANEDLTPPEALPYPKRAPGITHDIIEIERVASTQKPKHRQELRKQKLKFKRTQNG